MWQWINVYRQPSYAARVVDFDHLRIWRTIHNVAVDKRLVATIADHMCSEFAADHMCSENAKKIAGNVTQDKALWKDAVFHL